jgi:hypothetical protein
MLPKRTEHHHKAQICFQQLPGNAFAVGGLMNQADELTAKVKGSFDKRVFEDYAFLVVRGSGNAGDQFIAAKLYDGNSHPSQRIKYGKVSCVLGFASLKLVTKQGK